MKAANDSADGVAKVLYESKDGKATKAFDALDWLAQLTAHIPNRGEQPVESLKVERMVRYYFTRISRVGYEKRPAPMIKFRP